MDIFIKYWGEDYKTVALTVVWPYSITFVFTEIEARLGMPWQYQRLTFQGRPLDMYGDLTDYNIRDGDTIECQLRAGGGGEVCSVCDRFNHA